MMRAARISGSPLYALKSYSYSPALTWAAKCVPGMWWKDDQRAWCGYPDALEVVAALLKEKNIAVDLSALPKPDAWRSGPAFPFRESELRPYQCDGVRFLIAHAAEGALLADGMRLGKSCQSLVAARYFKSKTVVVCPSNVTGVWAEPRSLDSKGGEIEKWWPQTMGAVFQPEGVKDVPAGAIPANVHIVVIHYDILYAWVPEILAWLNGDPGYTLIIDEIHLVSGYDSRRAKAVRELARHAARRIGLSGTPMTNRPRDLHNAVDILCPGRLGPFFVRPDPYSPKQKMTGFAQRYCAAFEEQHGSGPDAESHWNFNGSSNEEELHARLQHFMLRRVKSEVDAQLPPKTRQLVPVKVPDKFAIKPTSAMLVDKAAARRALDLAADGKFKPALELLKAHVEEGERVICFTHRKAFAESVVDSLTARNIRADFITGDVPRAKRGDIIKAWRGDETPGVLACTIDTCSVGIDLSFSNVAVFVEMTWEDWELEQAEERLYRVGSGSKALIQYVIARGTGDELIASAVIAKIGLKKQVIGKSGDGLDDTLRGQREDGLKRLAAALREKQARLAKAAG
jgi:SNF2 family DNA or RNA helicase